MTVEEKVMELMDEEERERRKTLAEKEQEALKKLDVAFVEFRDAEARLNHAFDTLCDSASMETLSDSEKNDLLSATYKMIACAERYQRASIGAELARASMEYEED